MAGGVRWPSPAHTDSVTGLVPDATSAAMSRDCPTHRVPPSYVCGWWQQLHGQLAARRRGANRRCGRKTHPLVWSNGSSAGACQAAVQGMVNSGACHECPICFRDFLDGVVAVVTGECNHCLFKSCVLSVCKMKPPNSKRHLPTPSPPRRHQKPVQSHPVHRQSGPFLTRGLDAGLVVAVMLTFAACSGE